MTEEQATVEFVELDIDAFAAQAPRDRGSAPRSTTRRTRRATRSPAAGARDTSSSRPAATRRPPKKRRGAPTSARRPARISRRWRASCPMTRARRKSGGDLGDAERADFVGPFGDAVWSMEPGEMRGPVKTEFGWHVIKLEGVSPGDDTQLRGSACRTGDRSIRHSQVEKAFGDAQEELDTRAFESSGDIAAVAAQMKLPVKRVERYTRAGSAELGATPKVTAAVFSPDVHRWPRTAHRRDRTGEGRCARSQGPRASQREPLEEVRAEVARVCPAGGCREARRGARRRSREGAGEGRRLAGHGCDLEGRSRDAEPRNLRSRGPRGAGGSPRRPPSARRPRPASRRSALRPFPMAIRPSGP